MSLASTHSMATCKHMGSGREGDADFIMQSIKNHADEYMQESGLTFLARQKKKPMHLGMWTLASTKSCDKSLGTVRHNSTLVSCC